MGNVRLQRLLHSGRLIWLVLGVALGLRVAYAVRQPSLEWDAYLYRDIAHNLLGGHGYTLDGVKPTTAWSPVPTFLIAGVYLLGGNDFVVRLVWVVIGVLVVFAAYRLVLENHGRPAANLAALGVAIYPYNVVLGASTGTEIPNILLILVALLFLQRWLRTGTLSCAAVTGVALGLAVLTRPAALPFIPLVALLMLLRPRMVGVRARFAGAVLFAALAVAMFVPWAIRTSRITGCINVTTSVAAVNLWDGYNPWFIAFSQGRLDLKDYGRLKSLFTDAPKTQKEADRIYLAAVRRFFLEQPRQALTTVAYKAVKFWQVPGFTALATEPEQRPLKWVIIGAGLLSYLPIALLSLWAVVWSWRHQQLGQFGLYLAFAAATFATNVWFPAMVRYRFSGAVDEVMIVIAAVFVVTRLRLTEKPATAPNAIRRFGQLDG